MTDYKDSYKELAAHGALLKKHCPTVMKDFSSLHGNAIHDKTLDEKTKELIALGISIATRCEGCILHHVRGAIRAKASMQELAETVDVAILMGGGPATIYGAKALAIAEYLFENKI